MKTPRQLARSFLDLEAEEANTLLSDEEVEITEERRDDSPNKKKRSYSKMAPDSEEDDEDDEEEEDGLAAYRRFLKMQKEKRAKRKLLKEAEEESGEQEEKKAAISKKNVDEKKKKKHVISDDDEDVEEEVSPPSNQMAKMEEKSHEKEENSTKASSSTDENGFTNFNFGTIKGKGDSEKVLKYIICSGWMLKYGPISYNNKGGAGSYYAISIGLKPTPEKEPPTINFTRSQLQVLITSLSHYLAMVEKMKGIDKCVVEELPIDEEGFRDLTAFDESSTIKPRYSIEPTHYIIGNNPIKLPGGRTYTAVTFGRKPATNGKKHFCVDPPVRALPAIVIALKDIASKI